MPYRMTVSVSHRVVFSRVEGEVGIAEIEAFRAELARNPDFEASFDQIADLTRARSAPSYNELRRIAHTDLFSSTSRRAVVVPDDLHFGTYRAYDSLLGDDRASVRPFRSLAEACDWVGVPLAETLKYIGDEIGEQAG